MDPFIFHSLFRLQDYKPLLIRLLGKDSHEVEKAHCKRDASPEEEKIQCSGNLLSGIEAVGSCEPAAGEEQPEIGLLVDLPLVLLLELSVYEAEEPAALLRNAGLEPCFLKLILKYVKLCYIGIILPPCLQSIIIPFFSLTEPSSMTNHR